MAFDFSYKDSFIFLVISFFIIFIVPLLFSFFLSREYFLITFFFVCPIQFPPRSHISSLADSFSYRSLYFLVLVSYCSLSLVSLLTPVHTFFLTALFLCPYYPVHVSSSLFSSLMILSSHTFLHTNSISLSLQNGRWVDNANGVSPGGLICKDFLPQTDPDQSTCCSTAYQSFRWVFFHLPST